MVGLFLKFRLKTTNFIWPSSYTSVFSAIWRRWHKGSVGGKRPRLLDNHDKVVGIVDRCRGEQLSFPRPGMPEASIRSRPSFHVQLSGTPEQAGPIGAGSQSAPGSAKLPLN